jgi:hypothetical protein
MFQTNVAGLLFFNQCWHHGSDTARPAFHDTFIAFGFSDSSPLHYCVSPQGNALFKGIILLLCFVPRSDIVTSISITIVFPTFFLLSLSTSMIYKARKKKTTHPKFRTIAERSVSFHNDYL